MQTWSLAGWCCLGALVAAGATGRAEELTRLELKLERKGYPDFDANPVIDAPVDSVHLIGVDLLIHPTGYEERSVEGWSLALWHAELDLVSITIEGTVSADKEEGGLVDFGFRVYQVVDPQMNGGRRGVVQAVVLSHLRPTFLPSDQAHVVGRNVYRAQVTAEGTGAFLRYEDGLRGSGQPVVNAVTVRGHTQYPSLGVREIKVGANVVPEAGRCDDGLDNDRDTWTDCADPDCRSFVPCGFELCGDGLDNDGDAAVDCLDRDCFYEDSCREDCDDGIDNDGDGDVDCGDPECFPVLPCRVPEDCGDGIDNDRDGLIDCIDFECRGLGDCPGFEVCGDNIDNDLDGLLDCDDPNCFGILPCLGLEICGDGIDNNGDQKADCDDPQCVWFGGCLGSEVCSDGIDNDGDGKVDCDDPQCGGVEPCPVLEICGDGIDNDGDGATDCADPQCDRVPPCPGPEVCSDSFDNDGDGWVDCDDPECIGTQSCPPREVCDDGVDNDQDLRVDCADRDCRLHPACPTAELCGDGIDNDLDRAVDCDDLDCEDAPACAGGGGGGFDLVLQAEGARFVEGRSVVDIDIAGDGLLPVTVYIVPYPGPQPAGAQGWSLGISHDSALLDFDPEGGAPTLAGTDAAMAFSGGFQKTEMARPVGGAGAGVGGTQGFVSAVVLSFTEPRTLDPARAQSVARARYRVRGDLASLEWISSLVRFADGLRGSGQPLSNLLTVLGNSVEPLHLVPLEARLGSVTGSFVRGDVNVDRKVDLADAIWSVNELVRRGPPAPCPRAADVNADGLYDLSDVMYLIAWEFLSGSAIPPPFPACAAGIGPVALECPPGSVPYCR